MRLPAISVYLDTFGTSLDIIVVELQKGKVLHYNIDI